MDASIPLESSEIDIPVRTSWETAVPLRYKKDQPPPSSSQEEEEVAEDDYRQKPTSKSPPLSPSSNIATNHSNAVANASSSPPSSSSSSSSASHAIGNNNNNNNNSTLNNSTLNNSTLNNSINASMSMSGRPPRPRLDSQYSVLTSTSTLPGGNATMSVAKRTHGHDKRGYHQGKNRGEVMV